MIRRNKDDIGLHRLSPLEYEIYRLIELKPRRAAPEALRSAGDGAKAEAERAALANLEEQGFVERIAGDDGELLRLTPWGKAVSFLSRLWYRHELHDWLARHPLGEVVETHRRPRRSAVRVDLAPWQIGPSFDELAVEYLELSTRAENGLRRVGVLTVGQLVRMTEEELKGVKNIGAKSVEEIRLQLSRVALDLAPHGAAAAASTAQVRYPDWCAEPRLYEVAWRSKSLLAFDPESRGERALWTRLLTEMAYALDHPRPGAGGDPKAGRYVQLAFEALIRLVEPTWWRRRSPRELEEAELERVIELVGEYEPLVSRGETLRRAVADGREATWRLLEGAVTAGVETYVRGRDGVELRRCAELVEVVAESGARLAGAVARAGVRGIHHHRPPIPT